MTAAPPIPFSWLSAKPSSPKIFPNKFADLLKAFRQDQKIKRYPNWSTLLHYCEYSANPVGRLVLYLCGYRDEHRQRLSDATCTALQLANFWQDVSRDMEKGRIYIPLDEAAAHGITEKDILERHFDDRYVALMKSLITRTRTLFAEGAPLSKMVDARLKVDLELFSKGGIAVLDAIEVMGYDTLHRRPSISKTKQVRLLGRALVTRAVATNRKPEDLQNSAAINSLADSYRNASALSKPRTVIFITPFSSCPSPSATRSPPSTLSCASSMT